MRNFQRDIRSVTSETDLNRARTQAQDVREKLSDAIRQKKEELAALRPPSGSDDTYSRLEATRKYNEKRSTLEHSIQSYAQDDTTVQRELLELQTRTDLIKAGEKPDIALVRANRASTAADSAIAAQNAALKEKGLAPLSHDQEWAVFRQHFIVPDHVPGGLLDSANTVGKLHVPGAAKVEAENLATGLEEYGTSGEQREFLAKLEPAKSPEVQLLGYSKDRPVEGRLISVSGDNAKVRIGKQEYDVKVSQLGPTEAEKKVAQEAKFAAQREREIAEREAQSLGEAQARNEAEHLVTRSQASPAQIKEYYNNAKSGENFITYQLRKQSEAAAAELAKSAKVQHAYEGALKEFPKQRQNTIFKLSQETAFTKGNEVEVVYQDAQGQLRSIRAQMARDTDSVNPHLTVLHGGKEEEIPLKSVQSIKNREAGTKLVFPEHPDVSYGKSPRLKVASAEKGEPIVYRSSSSRQMNDAIRKTPDKSIVRIVPKKKELANELLDVDLEPEGWKDSPNTVGKGENQKFRDPATIADSKLRVRIMSGPHAGQSLLIDPVDIDSFEIVSVPDLYLH